MSWDQNLSAKRGRKGGRKVSSCLKVSPETFLWRAHMVCEWLSLGWSDSLGNKYKNLRQSSCLSLIHAGIIGMSHFVQFLCCLKIFSTLNKGFHIHPVPAHTNHLARLSCDQHLANAVYSAHIFSYENFDDFGVCICTSILVYMNMYVGTCGS